MNNESLEKENKLLKERYFRHTIKTLVSIIDSKDVFTKGHSEKVMKYCARIAKELRLCKNDILKIKIAALLHDVGKLKTGKAILNKPGKLTKQEWLEVKKHPTTGAEIVKASGLVDGVVDTIRHHHAHFGGGGYPDATKKGDKIPLGSRIILVADAYDAMTSKRPYRKKPMSKKDAVTELKRCSGTQFDPAVVSAFANIVRTLI